MECFLVKLAYSIQIYGSGTLRWAFSLESLRSSLHGFSKIAIIYGILQIIDKFCSGPLANFLIIAYIFMQIVRNAKQSFADISK